MPISMRVNLFAKLIAAVPVDPLHNGHVRTREDCGELTTWVCSWLAGWRNLLVVQLVPVYMAKERVIQDFLSRSTAADTKSLQWIFLQ